MVLIVKQNTKMFNLAIVQITISRVFLCVSLRHSRNECPNIDAGNISDPNFSKIHLTIGILRVSWYSEEINFCIARTKTNKSVEKTKYN